MTPPPPLTPTELDRILEDWMSGTPERVPEHLLDAAFSETRATPQPRRWRQRIGRGGDGDGGGGSKLPALVLVAAVLGGLGVVAGGSLLRTTADTDPTPSPQPSATPVVAGDPADLAASWIGVPERDPSDPDSGQAWVLRLGSFATLQGLKGEIQILAGFTADGAEIRFPSGTGACLNVPATYAWTVAEERLTLTATEDPCPERRDPLEAITWQLVPDGWSIGSLFRVPFIAPADALALSEATTTAHAFGGNSLDGGSGLAAWIVEDLIEDPCPPSGGELGTITLDPGPEGLVAGLRRMRNVEVGPTETATAAGLPATRVHLEVTGELCDFPGTARLWVDHGAAVGGSGLSTGQYLEAFKGGEVDLWIVEVDGVTVTLVAWTRQPDDYGPALEPERLDVIDRMRFIAPAS